MLSCTINMHFDMHVLKIDTLTIVDTPHLKVVSNCLVLSDGIDYSFSLPLSINWREASRLSCSLAESHKIHFGSKQLVRVISPRGDITFKKSPHIGRKFQKCLYKYSAQRVTKVLSSTVCIILDQGYLSRIPTAPIVYCTHVMRT
jgi:hypothetical protein